nr:hypothetical protein [Amycolatopsis thailandensis]
MSGTRWAARAWVPLDEINAQQEFSASRIDGDEFERVWNKALGRAED